MTDFVSIRDLSVPAVIGVHDWEREIEQTLVFSVDLAADVRKAAASDNLAETWLRLQVRKPITADTYTAAITIERTRENR